MSGIKAAATTIWTELLQAMRDDGLIANAITQSGPKTTAIIVQMAEQCMRPHAPWLQASILPATGIEVIAMDKRGNTGFATYSHAQGVWVDRFGADIPDIVRYTFIPKLENHDGP